jgi:ABC-type polysaccharide/polyol phosphate export permease
MLTATLAAVWAYRDLVRHLVLRDLRLKYKGSTLGVLWSLANPVIMAAVYTVAFKYIVRLPIERFPLFLLSGLVPWTFFAGALGASAASVVDNSALVRKVRFPRLVLPLAATLAQLVQFALTYALVIPALAWFDGGGLGVTALAAVPLMLLQSIFTAGLGLAAATANVHLRDTKHLLDVALQIGFWLTPVVYSLALAPKRLAALLAWNPLTHFVGAYQGAVVDGRWPSAGTFLLLALLAAGSAAAGLALFARSEGRFAEKL